jgi:predicted RNA binding protein with dsRBD fold (UPF0201 family)
MKPLPLTIAGVDYEVQWGKFRKGTSLFFPCLDRKAAVKELKRLAGKQKIQVIIREVIEEGIRGVRMWRV